MRLLFPGVMVLLLPALLTGCAVTSKSILPEGKPEQEVVLPFKQPEPSVTELDSDIVFSALAGEIALQRGKFDVAYRHQMQTAIMAEDAVAAERAARIALLMKREDLALRAAARWIALAPNDLSGRQLAEVLYFKAGQHERALEQMEAIVAINDSKGDDGFIPAMVVLSKEQDRPGARALMARFSAGYTSDPRAGYAMALISLLWKEYPQAEQEIVEVIARQPDWTRSYVLLSRVRKLQGDDAGALQVLEDAVKRYSNDPELHSALAKLLVQMNEYAKGYDQFRRVYRLSPDDTDALYSLGVLALQLERPREARGYFERLQKLGSRQDDSSYYLGRIAEQEGNPAQAIEWYQKVSAGDFHFEAQVRIAQVMADEGRQQEARMWLQNLRIRMKDQSVQLYLLEAKLLKEQGPPEAVLALFAKALDAHPDNDDLLYARGLYAAEIQRMDIMESDLRQVIGRDPNNADALNALGYTYADNFMRYDEALSLISRALAIKPDSPAVLDSMGWLQYRLGNNQKALDYLQRAFDLMPDSEIAAHLGEVLWVTGDRSGARAVWQQILDEQPDSKHIRQTMQRLQQ